MEQRYILVTYENKPEHDDRQMQIPCKKENSQQSVGSIEHYTGKMSMVETLGIDRVRGYIIESHHVYV